MMRGAPGVGKSTFIRENGLEQYALSADNIRMMYQSPVMQIDGSFNIAQTNEKEVWDTLFMVLESRMLRGEFVVIDATNSKTKEMNRYKDMASTYRYRIYCVDFTDVPIEECKCRNLLRPQYKQVPEEAIDKMYSRFATQDIPAGIKVLKPDELDTIWFRPIDLSQYKRIHHIGDIHGCNTVLQEYLKDGIKDDEFYIFCGDYIDRGIENVEVINFLYSLLDKKNVLMLEGNHERWLWYWAHGGTAKSKEFEQVTRPVLDRDLDPKIARMLYRRLGQCAWYTYGDKTVFVTHAGLSCIPENLTLIATEQMFRGVGRYSDYKQVAESFERLTPVNCYQIFGHRNTEDSPVQMSERTFNLEGRVEFGGCLRAVDLDAEGFHTVEVQNTVFKPIEERKEVAEYTAKELSIMELIDVMRKNKFIMEKKFGNISSFNFTREAFYDKVWNEQTTKARGLFIDTVNGKIVARSYEKFFQINERPETRFEFLQHRLKFPVTAYVKENGFLGIVSYNPETDDFFISSKSTPDGDFSGYMRDAFFANVNNPQNLKEWLRDANCSMVFECVDMERDPHIIRYDGNHLFLLDIIDNSMEFSHVPYESLRLIGNAYGFEVKTRAAELADWNEFRSWYDEVNDDDYLFNGHEIEGFVIEDSAGFMVKIKLPYYRLWKHMRSVAQETLRYGNYRQTGSLTTPLENHFFGFCKELFAKKDSIEVPTRIIDLRDMFMKQYAKKEDDNS